MGKFVQLKSGIKLLYASDSIVIQELNTMDSDIRSLCSSSDLEAGIYEGGLKIWECAVDLCNYLDKSVDCQDLDVLELGCGAGLPSIVALMEGANTVTVQDFNDFVLETFTKKNFTLNSPNLMDKCTFIPGEWGKSLLKEIGTRKFQLILTSETIYNESNYLSLLETMDSLLDKRGRILLAAKIYYFGVGGSIASFKEYLEKQGIFEVEEVWSTTKSSVARKILEIRRK